MILDLVDEVILLSEDEIATGMRHAYEQEREIIEGAAAVGIGALLAGKVQTKGPIVIILSGCNVDMSQHQKVICTSYTKRVEPCPA
jgi:threonine dehydratase